MDRRARLDQRAGTLDLDPDGGDAEFIEEVERAFGIMLGDDDVKDWLTLADVAATLARHRRTGERIDGACACAMAFYRLRRALVPEEGRRALSPSTPLSALMEDRPARFLWRLERASGLRMPRTTLTWFGTAAALLLVAVAMVAVALMVIGSWKFVFAVAFALGSGALFALDRGVLPIGLNSLGDLARRVALLNHAALLGDGAGLRPGDDWQVLVAVAAEESGLPPETITPETYLMRSMWERRSA